MSNYFIKNKKSFLYFIIILRNNFFKNNFLFTYSKKESKFFNFLEFYKSIIDIFFWTKIRTLYYVNNWIYTTNHKRIAVNYFWFVILSGIVGMVLATLIRLEFAYPGVGVFAGDSLQYLSMATAHGVIMVFFMIMPLLFGAFANFLIPTQLGVHDVAFPRLNSAAFWFLPGGLLMLCQLVCVDRRYQRMNCFNIREIQSILKRKFFTDLINNHDHHTLLNKTTMGLRFKTNNNAFNANISIFYNYGIEFTSKIRTNLFHFSNETPVTVSNYLTSTSVFFFFIHFFSNLNFFSFFNSLYYFFGSAFFFLSNLSLNFKNIFNNLLIIYYNFYYYLMFTGIFIINLFKNFFFILSNTISNFNHFFDIIINTPLFVFYFFINNFINFFYNNFNFLFKLKNPFSFNLNLDFFATNLSFYNLINDFFFFFNFFELSFFFRNTVSNYLFFWNYLLNCYNSLINFFKNIFAVFNTFSTSSTTYKFNKQNHDKTANMFSDTDLTKEKIGFYNKLFTSKLNYDSYTVYFYLLSRFILNLPNFAIYLIFNIFDIKKLFNFFSDFYFFLTNWFVPSVLSDNIFYYFYKNLNTFDSVSQSHNPSWLHHSILNVFNNTFFQINNPSPFSNFFRIFLNSVYFFSINAFFYFLNIVTSVLNLFIVLIFSIKTNVLFSSFYEILFLNITTNYSSFYVNNTISTLNYKSNYFNNSNLNFSNKYTNEELYDHARYLRFYNPIFKYDYKSGDYFPKLYKEFFYTYLFSTINDLTSSIRTAPWFNSDKYVEAFDINFLNYFDNVNKFYKSKNINAHDWSNSRFSNTDAFYNFFFILSKDFNYTNKKWIALNSLNQKFYRMFNTSSMQQRVYSNWRQLKFTREAWRCKLLAARHQKTLFRRYVHEDGVFWSIERNAKDLLPGWAMITPFSSRTRFTAIGKTDIGLMGVFLVLNSSIISGANFLVTYRYLSTLNNRKMRDARVFFTESIIVACWMMIFANPMLAIAILMLLSDRHWQTSFFDYSGGGDTVLFQHMFWFFGHPEVYVIIIPTFGFVNSMISYYLRKRVSARASLLYSMYTIAFLGFFVWGHHMYMVGLAHTTRMLFSTLTVMISVPAATKIMHWCVTTVNSSIAMELPLLFTFTFIFLFVSGGISGMCVAHTGMDVLFHDTFYVIGHFHVMLAGAAMFSSFGAFYFYFPAIFGVKYSRTYAYLHYVYYLLGQLMTVIPMFWLGYAGMPRRVLDYPASMGGWHSVISAGHMLSVAGLMAFFIMIFDSLRQGRAVTRNTFGISRYNTRLNFYLYETSKLIYLQQKGWVFLRLVKPNSVKLNNSIYFNFEPLETTLLNYTFYKNHK